MNNLRRIIANEDLSTVAKSLLKNWKKLVPGWLIYCLRKFLNKFLFKENSTVPINKDDKQPTPSYNSQLSQESITNPGKTIERQASQPASSSYTASQTHDEVRYGCEINFEGNFEFILD